MNEQEARIAERFDAWWKEAFAHVHCNPQSRANFIAFGVELERLWYSDLFKESA